MSGFIEEASDLFLFVSSIGVIVITLTIVLVGYQAAKTLEEWRELTKVVRGEAAAFAAGRKELSYQTKFIGTWFKIMGRHIFGR